MSKGKKSSPLVVGYLFLYNMASCLGWAYCLSICVRNIMHGTMNNIWDECSPVLKIVQTTALFEVFHSMIGLVKSPWFTTFLQVFSRVWTLWAVMNVAPPAQVSIFTVLACTSWSLVEVPRYLFYALNLVNAVPYPLFWLRYSLFAVLYPTGITGELGCMYFAAKYLYEVKLNSLSVIPSLGNSDFMLLLLIVLVVATYVPGSPKMFLHMVKTRKKQFAELKKSTEKTH